MTESEWLCCTEVLPMFDTLADRHAEVSGRKLRLFACACCRAVWPLLDPLSRTAVAVAERLADGLADDDERRRAQEAADEAARRRFQDVTGDAVHAPRRAYWAARMAATQTAWHAAEHAWTAEEAAVLDAARSRGVCAPFTCDLVREVFGNPFRPSVIADAWRTWGGGAAIRLAQGSYDRGDFADLPILGDALEEAGCTDEVILSHCRRGGGHVRGCWLVDALLGKA